MGKNRMNVDKLRLQNVYYYVPDERQLFLADIQSEQGKESVYFFISNSFTRDTAANRAGTIALTAGQVSSLITSL